MKKIKMITRTIKYMLAHIFNTMIICVLKQINMLVYLSTGL